MKSRTLTTVLLGVVLVAGLAASNSEGSTITWGTPTTISGNSDVSLTGTIDRAYNFTSAIGSGTTVNGVTFSNFKSQTTDTSTFGNWMDGAYASGSPPYNGLTAEYRLLLRSAGYDVTTAAKSVTLNNLTVGSQYLVQIWVNDSRADCAGRTETVSGSGTLQYNGGTEGSLGQYVIGTFTADATSQVLSFTGGGTIAVPQVNGLQLRTQAIPEPSAIILLSCGAIGLLVYAWRRRK